MISKGWIKLHRKIQDHWIYQEDRVFSRYEAWLDLIMLANHKDNKSLIDGELVTVKKGSLITSKRKLSDRWKWSNTKTDNFLKLLEQDGMITHKSDTKKTVITVVNYEVYHEKENEKRHENDSEVSGTSDEQVDSGNYNLEKNDTEKTVESFGSSELFSSEENEKRHENDTKTTQKHIKNETETYKQECKELKELKNDHAADIYARDDLKNDYDRIKSLYMQLSGKGGFDLSPKDEMAIQELFKEKVDIEKALVWLKQCFDEYEPKHSRDKINSFSYCLPFILDRHYAEKEGVESGKVQQYSRRNGRFTGQGKTTEQVLEELERDRQAWGG